VEGKFLGLRISRNGSPVTPQSPVFEPETASIVLTSAAIGLLLDEGRLKLDDEIQKYVPEFSGQSSGL